MPVPPLEVSVSIGGGIGSIAMKSCVGGIGRGDLVPSLVDEGCCARGEVTRLERAFVSKDDPCEDCLSSSTFASHMSE